MQVTLKIPGHLYDSAQSLRGLVPQAKFHAVLIAALYVGVESIAQRPGLLVASLREIEELRLALKCP